MKALAFHRPLVASASALVAAILVLVFSASMRGYAQDFLLLFRERPFSVVSIDVGVFQTGLEMLGMGSADVVKIDYERAPLTRLRQGADPETRGRLPRQPGGIATDPQALVWGPTKGALHLKLGPLPGLGGIGLPSLGAPGVGAPQLAPVFFDLPVASVILYADGPEALQSVLAGRLPAGPGRYVLYGESPLPKIEAGGPINLLQAIETLSAARMLPPQFRGQLRVVAEWLGYLLPEDAAGVKPEPPSPALIEGLSQGAAVLWIEEGVIRLLAGNIGADLLPELAKEIG